MRSPRTCSFDMWIKHSLIGTKTNHIKLPGLMFIQHRNSGVLISEVWFLMHNLSFSARVKHPSGNKTRGVQNENPPTCFNYWHWVDMTKSKPSPNMTQLTTLNHAQFYCQNAVETEITVNPTVQTWCKGATKRCGRKYKKGFSTKKARCKWCQKRLNTPLSVCQCRQNSDQCRCVQQNG